MADKTAIEWTDATVNFWWGCTKVGPGCDHCYAETWAKRTGSSIWGAGVPRRKIASAVKTLHRLDNDYAWWAADAQIAGIHPNSTRRVFIQSMSDLFDKEVPVEWFDEAWQTITVCDRLAIQIVTKRISFVEKRLNGKPWPKHAGLIISVVNQEEADRDIPRLLALKAKLGIPWVGLSMEPLLGPVDLTRIKRFPAGTADKEWINAVGGRMWTDQIGLPNPDPEWAYPGKAFSDGATGLDWVIVGGESGGGARPINRRWVRDIRDQCAAAGVPFLFKQWGEWFPFGEHDAEGCENTVSKGKRPSLWHEWGNGDGFSVRLGKKKAGRRLDNALHDGFPAAEQGGRG